ncbi:MAG: hypothetical protein EP329_27265 [Deltaproteobacteria bacterium]|nr:MAG: hypothetical protein EP329_27265 [Deltaproteobacteria bacterium]
MGRGLELARLRAFVLGAKNGAVCVIEGAVGCGKTALVDELWRVLPSLGLERTWIDPRAVGASRPLAGLTLPSEVSNVVVCDGWDEVARDLPSFFADAPPSPQDIVYVLAGRTVVDEVPAGRHVERLPLGPLGPYEIDAWLSRYGFERRQRAALSARTYGDPLALALAIDVDALGASLAPLPHGVPVIETLTDRLIGACKRTSTRLALYALALASPLDDADLAHALAIDDAQVMTQWLSQLATVRETPVGLSLHRGVATELLRNVREHDLPLLQLASDRLEASARLSRVIALS